MLVKLKKVLSLILIISGLVLLLVILLPIIFSQLAFWLWPTKSALLDPTITSKKNFQFEVLGASSDFTKPDTWFKGMSHKVNKPSIVSFFSLSIPSISLNNVPVELNGEDLKNNAIHYPNTAFPGELGNVVIFGHSTLPQLYKPRDPLSVFNFLPQVKRGDEILVQHDGVTYNYVIKETLEVAPDRIDVMAQRYDERKITLITCVPLGTYLRRFVVIGYLK